MGELFTPRLKQRSEECARCLDCGVPLCQSGLVFEGVRLGCPLHNLIPEWNDMLKRGNPSHALSRLLKVNPFPELTGRVCPAFCQRVCVRGETGEPISIRDNELFLIEYGFENGLVLPHPPAVRSGKTAAVVGAGPAGMAAACLLNRRGHAVTVYDRAGEPGGQLLSIPGGKLPGWVIARRVSLLEAEGVVFRTGREADAEGLRAEYDTVVVCAGPESKKDSLVVLAIAEGKQKAAAADTELMGYTNME